jgi:hypothetical protein
MAPQLGDMVYAPEVDAFTKIIHLANSFFCGLTLERNPMVVIFVHRALVKSPDYDVRRRYKKMYSGFQWGRHAVIVRENAWDGMNNVQKLANAALASYKEELISKACHPSRFFQWCLDTEEQKYM